MLHFTLNGIFRHHWFVYLESVTRYKFGLSLNLNWNFEVFFKKTDHQNLRLINGHFPTIFSHFFANYINIFDKTEVQMVILRCRMGLNLNWFKSYDTKHKCFRFCFFFSILKKNHHLCNVFPSRFLHSKS